MSGTLRDHAAANGLSQPQLVLDQQNLHDTRSHWSQTHAEDRAL